MQQVFNAEEERIRVLKCRKEQYEEYAALAMILSRPPKNPEDFSSLEELEELIADLKEEYQKKDEMDFIADRINEVMEEMGYSMVTSKVLTQKDRKETEVSLYRESGQAGIAVYTDQSGAVMMRMTVLGNTPDISDADREFSYQSQIEFCARHSDLVEALAEKGVYLKQKSYRAPSRDHTFKVDISSQNVTVADSQKDKKPQKINRRARRRAGNHKMRTL